MPATSEMQAAASYWPTTDFTSLDRSKMGDSAKWQLALSNGLQHAAIGFLAAGGASVLLARSTTMRVGITAVGAGFGVGRAYVDMRYLFNHDVAANRAWIASVTPAAKPAAASGEGEAGEAQ
eukprot:CAMPEP_0174847690 /NCGR_PEP_ID=MMETSP1114-20130205/13068_1 /TAXON_ID=312471 /ORGANISM="Neobodo designis, Strain CCAP 1951/1" /LENGTH=121 /DNA_ID=CAMNT_0016081971 /DNA_START=40 /DNA_END=405 /DNA_ORIENTATION=+